MKTLKSLIPIAIVASVAWAASAQPASATVQTPVASVSASVPSAPPDLAFGVTQVLKLQQSGISKDVLLNYVINADLSFHMKADDIVYLHNVGVPEEVISAMMTKARNTVVVAETPPPVQQQPVAQQPQTTMVNPPNPTTVVTQPQVVYSSPSYAYGYPYYPYYGGSYYPYYYGAPVSLNFGFGWGSHWGGGWHGGHGGWGGGWHGGGGHHH